MKRITTAFSHQNVESKRLGRKDWLKKNKNESIISSDPLHVKTYNELVQAIALLNYHNRDLHLFYRGQDKDYTKKNRQSTILPSIYRIKSGEKEINLREKFEILRVAETELENKLNSHPIRFSGTHLIMKYPEIRYSLLQHYEVCGTPVLDLTHSLHVACSFAFDRNKNETGIVYVFGMPAIAESISYYVSQELFNIRLLSIAPPRAKRPFFQEGYIAGPFPLFEIDKATKLPQFDFARRLVGKFEIPRNESFWGSDGFRQINPNRLYQPDDQIDIICKDIINIINK